MHGKDKKSAIIHRILSVRSRFLDWVGRRALRFYLYRQNLFFDPNLNGEHRLLDMLKASGFSPKTIFDIGANEGRWSDHVGTMWPDAQIHLFEPMSGIVERLKKRFQGKNQFFIHQAAVGSASGKIKVSENIALSSHSFVGLADPLSPEVDLYSGSRCLEVADVRKVELLKIDAEGYDLAIIKSLRLELMAHKLSVIQFEHHQLAVSYGDRFADVTALLRECGYRVGKLYPEGLKEVRYGEYDWEYIVGPNFCAMSPDCNLLFEKMLTR